MFSYIIGKIEEKGEDYVVCEANNIGYEIFVSSFTLQNLEENMIDVKIFTYYQQREDGVSLFGFLSREEKDLFLKLISVSGVGPKGAMAILSGIEYHDLLVVIAKGNLSALSKVKGVGKKTAERILVDLKDKVDVLPMELLNTKDEAGGSEFEDALQVLVGLGMTKQDATRLLENNYEAGDDAETLVSKALSNMK